MAGNKEGGKKAAITNKKNHGPDYYKNIGKKGGRGGRKVPEPAGVVDDSSRSS